MIEDQKGGLNLGLNVNEEAQEKALKAKEKAQEVASKRAQRVADKALKRANKKEEDVDEAMPSLEYLAIQEKGQPPTIAIYRSLYERMDAIAIESRIFEDAAKPETRAFFDKILGEPMGKITPLDYRAFMRGLCCTLSEESQKSGGRHYEENTGLTHEIVPSKQGGSGGWIEFSMSEHCMHGYGKAPRWEQREAQETLFNIFHHIPLKALKHGVTAKTRLLSIISKYKHEETGALYYVLLLSPFFTKTLEGKGFGRIYNNTMENLAQHTEQLLPEHYDLELFIAFHSAGSHTIETIIEALGMQDAYKKERAAVEDRVIRLFSDFRKAGELNAVRYEYEGGAKFSKSRRGKKKRNRLLRVSYTRATKRGVEENVQGDVQGGGNDPVELDLFEQQKG